MAIKILPYLKLIILLFTLHLLSSCQSFQEYCKEEIKTVYVGASSTDDYYECINDSQKPWKTQKNDYVNFWYK